VARGALVEACPTCRRQKPPPPRPRRRPPSGPRSPRRRAPSRPRPTARERSTILAQVPASLRAGGRPLAARRPDTGLRAAPRTDDPAGARPGQLAVDRQRAKGARPSTRSRQLGASAAPAQARAASLPVLQLALPIPEGAGSQSALGSASPGTLDRLVRTGGMVTPFEYALQRMVLRDAGREPRPRGLAVTQIYSFQAVADEVSVVLSTIAHASSANPDEAAKGLRRGGRAAEACPGPDDPPCLADAGSRHGASSTQALGKTRRASSGPIKQRLLVAAAHVVSADGVMLTEESELLRADRCVPGRARPPDGLDWRPAFFQIKKDGARPFVGVCVCHLLATL
jgi:hypothetical protein